MAKGKEVAVKEASPLAISGLADLQSDGGFVSVRKELIKIPRLQLGQAMSDAVQAGVGKAGEFISSVKVQNYGTSVKIIPILISESAALMEKNTKKVLCTSSDLIHNKEGKSCKECPYGQYWNDWNMPEPPQCKTSIDVVCIVNDEFDMPQVLSFRKMSFKAGKALVNLTMHDKYKVPFGSQYELKSRLDTKDDYKFYVIEDSISKQDLTEEQLAKVIPIARQMLDMKKQGRITHEDEGEQPQEQAPIEYGDTLPEGI